jgi:hypothetical protein
VVAAGYTALVGLFPTQQPALDIRYGASLALLADECEHGGQSHGRGLSCATRIERGVAWGTEVAQAVLAWRAADGFNVSYSPYQGGTAIGQWRPVPPATAMSAQALAFTDPFVVISNTQFQPPPPRGLLSRTYTEDVNTVKSLGAKTGSARTDGQTALAPFWEGNASVHWNQAANQIAHANHLSLSDSNRLLAVLNIAMADTAFTTWWSKRFYAAAVPIEVTWRPVTAIPLAGADGNPDTDPDPTWVPLVTTPSHPEYPAGHPVRTAPQRRCSSLTSDPDRRLPSRRADNRAARIRALRKHARTVTTPGSGAACTTRAPSRSATPSAKRSPSTSIDTR